MRDLSFLDSHQGCAKVGLLSVLIQRFPGCIIRRLSVCTRMDLLDLTSDLKPAKVLWNTKVLPKLGI